MCQNRNHKTMESLEQSLERVNAWIGNCDQKAGFLLAIIGVLVAILFSSDFIQSIMDIIVNPYKDYIRNPENNEFKLIRFIYSIFIVVSMTASIVSIIFALLSLTAAIDIKKYKRDINNSELVDNSLIFLVVFPAENTMILKRWQMSTTKMISKAKYLSIQLSVLGNSSATT